MERTYLEKFELRPLCQTMLKGGSVFQVSIQTDRSPSGDMRIPFFQTNVMNNCEVFVRTVRSLSEKRSLKRAEIIHAGRFCWICHSRSGAVLPDGPFHGQFRNVLPFFDCAGHEKPHLAILWNFAIFLAIFLVCHCKITFSSNILSFFDGLHVTHY